MIDLQPINTGNLIGIAQFAVGITQCAVIWHGLYTMRADIRQREKALDEIIAQGKEAREGSRKSSEGLKKSIEALAVLLQRTA